MLKWYQRINPFYLYDQYKRNQNMIDTLTSNMLYLNEKCRYYREEKNKYWWGLKVIAEDKVRHERLLR